MHGGGCFRVCVRVRLLRRASSTRGQGGELCIHWVGGEGCGCKNSVRGGGGQGKEGGYLNSPLHSEHFDYT